MPTVERLKFVSQLICLFCISERVFANVKPTKPDALQIHLIPAQQTQHNDNICGGVALSAMLIVQAFSILYKVGWNFLF